jgi:hypothetical protein
VAGVARERPGGDAWPARGGGSPEPRRKSAGDLDLGLWCTVLSAVSSYTKLRSSRIYLGQKGGGSGDHDGAPWTAADGRPRHTAATALIAPGARKKERRPLSHIDVKLPAKKGALEERWRGRSMSLGSSLGGGGSPVRLGPEAREGDPLT